LASKIATGGEKSRNNSGRSAGGNLEKDSDVIDAGLSLLALIVVSVLVIGTGGFKHLTPWFLWPAVVFFLLGLSRRVETNENLWRRVGMLNVAWLLVTPVPFLIRPWWLGALFVIVPPLPTAAGLYVRRLIRAWRK
jgi:hypothetical protein